MLIKDNMACFNEKSASNPLGIFESFDSLTKVLGMLTFGAFIVIHRSNCLSESQIDQNTSCTTLIQCNIPLGESGTGLTFCPRVEAKWFDSILFYFPVS